MGIDIYSMVTDRIIEALENGTVPWHKPWHSNGTRLAISHVTGRPYSLLNQLFLGTEPGEYITFKQCAQEGGYVRKGEKSKFVVFWKFLEDIDKETGEVKKIPYLRYYNVFHISQCEGIHPRYAVSVSAVSPAEADEAADHIIDGYVARSGINLIIRESSEAYYSPATDTVVLPQLSQFESTAEYYSTAFHELTHSTGHSSRLNRLDQAAHFGNEVYSREELVAELGAAALVNHVGLETASSFRNNAAYIAGWLKALQDDKRLVVVAAGKAEKAVKMILGEKDKERGADNE